MRILPSGARPSFLQRVRIALQRRLHPPRTAMEFMEAVVTAEREHRIHASLKLCAAGLVRFPDDYYLLMKRLAQVRETGDAQTAIALLERAVVQCPETAATLCSAGEEYAYLGKMSDAEEFFRRAVNRMPANALAREKLAMALIYQDRYSEGLAELSAALDAEPGNLQRRNLLLQALLQAERFEEVVTRIEQSPDDSRSWEDLMALSVARARLAGATDVAEALLHPAPVPEVAGII